MAKANVVTIEHLEVSRKDIDVIKKTFKVKNNAEAVQKALDLVPAN
ncbi:MAG: hypothetical protein M1497_06290 [Nitrospirae bacterium]|nr:hypothetical protein [Nitrospirota bacterium]